MKWSNAAKETAVLQTKIFISQNNMMMLLKKKGLGVHGIDKYFEVLLIN